MEEAVTHWEKDPHTDPQLHQTTRQTVQSVLRVCERISIRTDPEHVLAPLKKASVCLNVCEKGGVWFGAEHFEWSEE